MSLFYTNLAAEVVGVLSRDVLAVAIAGRAEGVPDDGTAAAAAVDRVEDEVVIGVLRSRLERLTSVAWLVQKLYQHISVERVGTQG